MRDILGTGFNAFNPALDIIILDMDDRFLIQQKAAFTLAFILHRNQGSYKIAEMEFQVNSRFFPGIVRPLGYGLI